MKIWLIFLLLPGAFRAAAQPAAPLLVAATSSSRPVLRLRQPASAPVKRVAAVVPADTVVARQFLEAVADTLVPDSVVVARFMCADILLRQHEPRIDTAVARLRASLFFLRAGLVTHRETVRRSRFVRFEKLPWKPPFELAGDTAGAYVLLEGEKPRQCLLVRNGRVAAFELSFSEGPRKAHFRDYCR